jgi:hypothetical protein
MAGMQMAVVQDFERRRLQCSAQRSFDASGGDGVHKAAPGRSQAA